MATSQKTVLSNSSRNSPEAYKQHANTPYMAHSKNTYRHVPGHPHQMPVQQPHYGQMMPGGMPYPGPMGPPHPQFYPMGAPNPGYGPVYNHGPDQLSYYYYPHPSWPVPGAIAVYPQPGYANSPPPTPPHSGVPYGYQVAPGPEFYGAQLLPPTPPHTNNYHGSSQAPAANPVPQLEQRRSSWSSSAASESPTTPFMASAQADTGPIIVEETHPMVASNSGSNDVVYGQPATPHEKKSVEALLLAGPPLPTPIPALFSPESARNVNQALDNPTHTTNVYIRGLPPDTDDDKLYEMTCRFGTVVSHKAIMDTDHGTCKGYGFARYENTDEAEDCIRGLVSSKYEAGFARESFNARLKTLADPNSTNVYVSNLPRSMNEKTMQDIFSGFTVVSNRILRDPEGNSRGVGFARFEDRSICDEIIRNFHGKLVGEEQTPLQVRYADTSAQKRLKATTTKKRQFRSNEYNSVVNGCYSSIPHNNAQSNRTWPTSGPSNTLTFPVIRQSGSGKPGDWEAPHWRPSTAIDQLEETVQENGNDGDSVSVSKTETNDINSPISFDSLSCSLGKTSSGSFSDPGDSYGGLEVSHGAHSF